jgi:hypothetical protein
MCGGGVSNGRPSTVLLEAQTTFFDPEAARRLEYVVGAQGVGPEDLGVRNEARRRDRREVHDRVRGRVFVHAGEHLQRVPEVGHVGSDERAAVVAGEHEL